MRGGRLWLVAAGALLLLAGRAPAQGATAAARKVVVNGVDLTGVGYDRGRADAPIVIVEFSDFGCPYCGSHARETLPALEREFIATGQVFYKYVPFVAGAFPNARQATRAAECAAEQGRFWPMHDTLFAQQAEWKKALSPFATLTRYARGIRLDEGRFRACYVAHEPHHPRTRLADDRAGRLGIRVTPTFAVNGRLLEGALPVAEFRRILRALAAGR